MRAAPANMFLRIAYILYRIYLFFVRPVKIGVRVMLLKEDRVLLVSQTYMPGWYMPGGGVKRGETLEAAARREVREETGIELDQIQLLGAYTHFKEWKTDHNIVFLSRDFRMSGPHDREIAEVRFFSLDALPADLWPGHRVRLEEVRSGRPHPAFGEW
jgi:8-oxo-dGTP pyrophosphatase MutT (NUDIX family)